MLTSSLNKSTIGKSIGKSYHTLCTFSTHERDGFPTELFVVYSQDHVGGTIGADEDQTSIGKQFIGVRAERSGVYDLTQPFIGAQGFGNLNRYSAIGAMLVMGIE